MLECMMLIRAYEERLAALQAEGAAAGICTAVGQEASAVGVIRALGPQDKILTNHRSAGHLLARGADPGRLMAEVLGRATGYCKGKSGSLHVSAAELGVVLTSTIVGGELSLATGVALAKKMLGEEGIVACFFGDGAACEGIFHESLNLASVWQLPLLYVCENNQWQAFVHRRETMAGDHVSGWAPGYGIRSMTVDGNDAEAVLAAATEAVAYVRAEGKPFLLETCTYRLRGHFEPDDQSYVDAAELAGWRERDPIPALRRRLLADGRLGAAELPAMEARVRDTISAALDYARSSPFPALSELTTDVYA
ncbi:acetoin:2,6-dichlorophenolindophenol oxidoreductase subunit alpha [Noviherbaspirillum aridicola]|uniref:Acetoin:2,6-dichlorophenolindophenol oxidoreductase subunit alpha n=2 Tax=Noviherbaspirillum aridicola TaxID=2849687 RepID=A0ABQ4Q4C0_9BURK|nr:acetoin:2,6-dichlorophenolindophenol oxidoreductase subunit alpha [Noviherbaspirillum aridicola]